MLASDMMRFLKENGRLKLRAKSKEEKLLLWRIMCCLISFFGNPNKPHFRLSARIMASLSAETSAVKDEENVLLAIVAIRSLLSESLNTIVVDPEQDTAKQHRCCSLSILSVVDVG
ncbi:hypothetical protein PIB30_016892 [Stylosanthes scabra]|uniref:Uncharacterized protein n=1 Tax=Stylosanthes scabra TaxID=79078 RepID=A0ABU6V7P6_9FABA|nr:hypothetical protein [Stylosanthes scabra]